MWSKHQPTPEYPVAGRILNRHNRGRPRFRLLQRLKRSGLKLIIPLSVFGVIGLLVYIADWVGLI